MSEGRRALLLYALRASRAGGAHGEWARQVALFVIVAEMLAAAGHAGPPHRPFSPPRSERRRPARLLRRGSVSGRRPRG